jgi:TRAP-type C4-dicarboxylate transport system substrate-binding protein
MGVAQILLLSWIYRGLLGDGRCTPEVEEKPVIKKFLNLALLGVAMTCLSGQAQAQEKIKLRVATFLPATHFQIANGSNVWMDEVKRLTNGRVEFEYYPAEQLGKAAKLMELMQAGAIDVAEVAPAYVTEQLPLVGVLEMPGLVPGSCAGAKALRALAEPGGTIYESDFKSSKVRPLTFFIYPPYKLFTTPKPVEKVEDFQGLKLRTSGGVMELATNKLNAVSVRLSAPEVFDSLSRGTIDGVFYSSLSLRDAHLQTVAKYGAFGFNFGAPSVIISMSDAKFNSLPQDIQDALVKAGPVADQSYCSYVDKNEALVTEAIAKEGLQITTFNDDEKKRLGELLSAVGTEWAARLDAKGRPGAKALEDFRAALGATN